MNFLYFFSIKNPFYFSYMTKLCLKILLVHLIGTGKRGQCYKMKIIKKELYKFMYHTQNILDIVCENLKYIE